mmetsp:Transcript_88376/g.146860  ORF Transcript_88376/g.146860 Transcript_88376/m.146860 type:complete len:240 (-) Transcript_88376:732-1451(-)
MLCWRSPTRPPFGPRTTALLGSSPHGTLHSMRPCGIHPCRSPHGILALSNSPHGTLTHCSVRRTSGPRHGARAQRHGGRGTKVTVITLRVDGLLAIGGPTTGTTMNLESVVQAVIGARAGRGEPRTTARTMMTGGVPIGTRASLPPQMTGTMDGMTAPKARVGRNMPPREVETRTSGSTMIGMTQEAMMARKVVTRMSGRTTIGTMALRARVARNSHRKRKVRPARKRVEGLSKVAIAL